jgi:all-trans-retinol 13,14-reductase
LPEHKLDYLILGGGVSGLACASVLSKLDKKVLVLERNGKAGGCMHTFRKAEMDFDTGFHYVGNDPALHLLLRLVLSDSVGWNIYD